ncbi:cytochrome P450 1B1 [Mactra antiquata]
MDIWWSLTADVDKICLLLLMLILSVIYLWRNRLSDIPNGPFSFPFTGNGKILQDKPHINLTVLKDQYGRIYSIKLGKQRAIVVCSHEGIVEALIKLSPKLCGRPKMFLPQGFFKGNHEAGVCFSELNMKYKIKKDFVLHSLNSISCSEELSDVVMNEIQGVIALLLEKKAALEILPLFESIFLRLMLYIVNGKLYQGDDVNFKEILRTFQYRADELHQKWLSVTSPLLSSFNQRNRTELIERTQLQFEYQRDIVNRHKDCFNPDIISDVVDHGLLMLERYDDMGELDQSELDTLFIELCGTGYRQLASTISWLILYIASFPNIQHKVYTELISVIGKERLPKLSDQPNLPYTTAVILETQRLASVMPLLYPHITVEDVTFSGFNIPKDTVVLFNVWSVHHDAKYWKQPMKFDPDRFIKDGCLHIPDHYLPFGEGLRACPGENITDVLLFLFASHIMFHVSAKLLDDSDLEGNFHGFVLTPKPYAAEFIPRETVVNDVLDIPDSRDTVCYMDGLEI